MKVQLPLILDAISEYPVISSISNPQSMSFSWASFLPERYGALLRHDILYICPLSRARQAIADHGAGYYFICIYGEPQPPQLYMQPAEPESAANLSGVDISGILADVKEDNVLSDINSYDIQDRMESEDPPAADETSATVKQETEENDDVVPAGCILVKNLTSLLNLAELLQDRICQIRDWVNELNESAINSRSYQDVLDISEKIISNPVYILDASYKLLAYTKNITDDDEIDVRLRDLGFHSEETMNSFREHKRFDVYKTETGILLNPPGNPNKYATIGKWLWDRSMPVLHIIMVCSNEKEISDSLIASFEIIAKNCAVRFRQNQEVAPHSGKYYDTLLQEMLFEDLSNPRIIIEKAKIAGIPMTGNFNCYKIMLKDVNSYPIRWLLDGFLAIVPSSLAIVHSNEIITLNNMNSANEDTNINLIYPFLEKYNAVCGVSEPFNVLWDFKDAYTQATRALGLGEPLLAYEGEWNSVAGAWGALNPPRDQYVFLYDRILPYYITSFAHTGEFDIYKNTPYLKVVNELIKYDSQHNTNNAQVLYVYLTNERKATKTGEILHMHRNNVLYRIPRIEEQIGMDLDDYWVRLNLLMAFHLTELTTAHKKAQTPKENT